MAFDPPSNSIVVAHQGTDKEDPESVFNDVDLFFDDPHDDILPGAKEAGVRLHGGFQDT